MLIKWVGGKTQLLDNLISLMPKDYTTYVEPFISGGALFFNVNPKEAIINDLNIELVNLYKQVKENPNKLSLLLAKLETEYNNSTDKENYYYSKRQEFNDNIFNANTVDDAALMIFLNKCCFNGLYRVNRKGLFNSPWGKKDKLNLTGIDIFAYSKSLLDTKIMNGDFEKVCGNLPEKSFVYFDSPYYDTFDTYQSGGFSEADHIRLKELVDRLTKENIYCMLSNSNTNFIKDLYKDYNIKIVNVKRNINRNGNNRKGQEVIITNY